MSRRRFQTKPLIFCLKTLLLVYSFVFWVSGIVLLSVGLWWILMLGPYSVLISRTPSAVPFVLSGTGGGIVLLSLFGCWATCRGRCWMLRTFAVLLTLVFLTELIAGISGFIFRHEIKGSFFSSFSEAVQKYNALDERSLAVDDLQRKLHCCGVSNFSSWLHSSYFPNGGVPVSCCVRINDCERDDLRNASRAGDKVYDQGCFELVTAFFDTNLGIIASVTFGIAFSQLIGTTVACCLSRFINTNQYQMV
ncbi:tetraspanin-7-like [Periophthalmus magnuspinnatus]|uniref:tetraspanin-7-like n=1 Tax=Periophthalmus magnuspinnatus TaxID=409849 RepID=UPI002437321A|nr:tetraspanin-7-like [Periophthalmus magnuspinnatus]